MYGYVHNTGVNFRELPFVTDPSSFLSRNIYLYMKHTRIRKYIDIYEARCARSILRERIDAGNSSGRVAGGVRGESPSSTRPECLPGSPVNSG